MDALPIEEQTNVPYASKHKGVMHACGHDAHTASLLGSASILSQLRDDWEGTVLFIFQPGEETFPGGAKLLLDEGALNNPKPQLIIGQHVLPEMAAGNVGFKEGLYMASGDEIYLTITGKGGHGAMPHTLNDTVLAAAHTVVALQQITSRFVPANIPTVLSFGKFIANGATNIIPEIVEIAGTLRTMDESWRQKIKEKIITTAQAVSEAMGTECKVTINNGYPMVYNHPGLTRQSINLAKEFLGNDHVEEMDLRMTAEDFGYYSQVFPSTFYRFGVKQLTGDTGALHTSCFNLNDEALETSAGLMAWLAISLIAEQ
jgi:amidohydrolase